MADTPVAAPAVAPAAKPAAVKLLTTSQRNILRKGRLRVRVRARRRGSVRLVARAHRGVPPGKGRPVTRSKVVRFRRAGRRIVRLRLTPAGRRTVAGCEPMRLSVRGALAAAAQAPPHAALAFAADRRVLRHDSRRCRRTALAERLAEQVELGNADRCDFLDPTVCLYPWPNDRFTVRDANTASGRRLNLDPSRCRRTASARASRPLRTTATTASAPAT